MDFPAELWGWVLDHVSAQPPSGYLQLRLVDRSTHDRVTGPLLRHKLKHVHVEGSLFPVIYPGGILNNRTSPAVERLTVRLICANTEEDQEEQPHRLRYVLNHFAENFENIREVRILFDKPALDENWEQTLEGRQHIKKLRKYQDRILDFAVGFIRWYAEGEDWEALCRPTGHRRSDPNEVYKWKEEWEAVRRNIRLRFRDPDDWHRCLNGLVTCAGRNPGIIVVGTGQCLGLECTTACPGSPARPSVCTPGTLREWSWRMAGWVCETLEDIHDITLASSTPGLSPQRWGLLAEEITYQRCRLIGASTAEATDMNVPPDLRAPFDSAINMLNDVAETFQEAARTGDESGTNRAKSQISQAHAALKAVWDNEATRIALINQSLDEEYPNDGEDGSEDSRSESSDGQEDYEDEGQEDEGKEAEGNNESSVTDDSDDDDNVWLGEGVWV